MKIDNTEPGKWEDESTRSVLLSGIQPTGQLMIGNYIGALKNWVDLQDAYDCLFVLVDLHAITVRQDPEVLRRRCFDFTALYIACGIDPEKNAIFVQSHVPGHSQLLWILNCFANMGELNRMTQFKEKSKRYRDNINVGLFDYPVLMASDILLYGTDLVPVGEDQKQHLEFTRDLARRFNHLYGEIFKIPEPYIPREGARIMGLQNPDAKMSKTDENARNYIALLDTPEVIRKKIGQAVTDPGKEIRSDPSKPGISNLITVFSSVSGLSAESIQQRYEGKGYAVFKKELSERVVEFLGPIQKRYREIAADPEGVRSVLKKGAQEARRRSSKMLESVHDALGFIP